MSDVAKSQGFMRIHFRYRTKNATSVSTTTAQLPLDAIIENHLQKTKQNRFADFHQLRNSARSKNSIFIGLPIVLCMFLLKNRMK